VGKELLFRKYEPFRRPQKVINEPLRQQYRQKGTLESEILFKFDSFVNQNFSIYERKINLLNSHYLRTDKGDIKVYNTKQFCKYINRTRHNIIRWRRYNRFPDPFLLKKAVNHLIGTGENKGYAFYYIKEHLIYVKALIEFFKIEKWKINKMFYKLADKYFLEIKKNFLKNYKIIGGIYVGKKTKQNRT